jgi:uncharacterized membrane protein YhaH (DUF805 family)
VIQKKVTSHSYTTNLNNSWRKVDGNMLWYFRGIKKYAVFGGRARRKAYWYFILFNNILSFLFGYMLTDPFRVRGFGLASVLPFIFILGMLLPGLAVAVRRMHDVGRSGWWLLVPIANIIFALTDSDPIDNQYGPNPKLNEPETTMTMHAWKKRFILMGLAWLISIIFERIFGGLYIIDFTAIFFSLLIFEILYWTRKWETPLKLIIYVILLIVLFPYLANLIWYLLYDIGSLFNIFKISMLEYFQNWRSPYMLRAIVYSITFTFIAYLLVRKIKDKNNAIDTSENYELEKA